MFVKKHLHDLLVHEVRYDGVWEHVAWERHTREKVAMRSMSEPSLDWGEVLHSRLSFYRCRHEDLGYVEPKIITIWNEIT